jgi:hypothetical protein
MCSYPEVTTPSASVRRLSTTVSPLGGAAGLAFAHAQARLASTRALAAAAAVDAATAQAMADEAALSAFDASASPYLLSGEDLHLQLCFADPYLKKC